MNLDNESLLCLSCGEENRSGPYCSKCRGSLRIEAAQLPDLIQARLRLEGFQTACSAQEVQLVSSLSGVFHDIEKMKLSQVLLLPGLTPDRSDTFLTMAVVASASHDAIAAIQSLAQGLLGGVLSFFAGTNAQLGRVRLRVYIVYTEGIPAASMEQHRLPLRLRMRRIKSSSLFSLRMVGIELKPIDGTTGQWRYLNRFGTADRAVRSAVRQLVRVDQPDDASQASFGRVLKLVALRSFDQIAEYGRLLALAGEHEILSWKIRNDRIAATELVKALILSAFLAGMFAKLLHVDTGEIKTPFSVLDSTFNCLFVMVVYLISAAFVHWPLRLVGGKAEFRHTFVATAFVSAAVYPIVVLLAGLAMYLGQDETEAWTNAQASTGTLSWYVFAATHGISRVRTFAVLSVALPVAIIVVGLVVLAFFAAIAQT